MGRKIAVVGVAAVLAAGMMPTAVAAATMTQQVPCRTPALVSAVSGAASGATLSLAKGCTYVLTSALPAVAQDLTINGDGATLHRSTAAAAFTIVTMTAGAVTLNRLSFTNGNGAIMLENQAHLTVTGGVFRGNTAANGAAIDTSAFNATTADVTGASFIGNTAAGLGGAIYVNSLLGDLFTDCSFLGNTAGGGGAIFEDSNATGIIDSTFRGNTAATGGALYLDDQGPWITGTVMQGSTATGDGGGIFDGPNGFAVRITDSTIIGNHAGGAGGGLDEEENGIFPGSIAHTIIAGNSAADGGGINEGDGSATQYTGDVISGNHASGDGGGISAVDSQLRFTGTTISGNQAGGDGGGVDIGIGIGIVGDPDNGFGSFTDSTVSGNHARARGGGLYNQEPLDASSTQITGNRAPGGGGGIYDDGPEAMVTLTHSSPAGNKPDNCEPPGSITGCTG